MAGICMMAVVGGGMAVHPAEAEASEESVPVYRIYNPNTGEHLYTITEGEAKNCVRLGWQDEGIGWYTALSGDPVYRLYNPNAKGGDHYYTKSKGEADYLVRLGWSLDYGGNPVFYSKGDKNLYVAYNPNAESGAHNYTMSRGEQDFLLKNGWMHDAVAWKVMDKKETYTVSVPVDVNIVGPGGGEELIDGSYRLLYSDKPFDQFSGNELPAFEFAADVKMTGTTDDYSVQFVVAGSGYQEGQIGITLHYQKGNDQRYAQGRINATTINFPAKSNVYGEQFYSVHTAYPAIPNGGTSRLKVQYFDSGYMRAYVNDTLIGQYKTKLLTAEKNAYIPHFNGDTNCEVSNISVLRYGKDFTDHGAPGFQASSYSIGPGEAVSAAFLLKMPWE